jgi:hypothetical protein
MLVVLLRLPLVVASMLPLAALQWAVLLLAA